MATKHLLLVGGACLVAYALYSRQNGTASLPAQISGTYGATSSGIDTTVPLVAGTDTVIQGMESQTSTPSVVASPSALTNLIPGTPGNAGPKDKATITPVMWGGGAAAHPLEFN